MRTHARAKLARCVAHARAAHCAHSSARSHACHGAQCANELAQRTRGRVPHACRGPPRAGEARERQRESALAAERERAREGAVGRPRTARDRERERALGTEAPGIRAVRKPANSAAHDVRQGGCHGDAHCLVQRVSRTHVRATLAWCSTRARAALSCASPWCSPLSVQREHRTRRVRRLGRGAQHRQTHAQQHANTHARARRCKRSGGRVGGGGGAAGGDGGPDKGDRRHQRTAAVNTHVLRGSI